MAYPTYIKPKISSAPTYRGGAFREMPTYSGPGWNEGEITGLAQRRAAPGLRAMRSQLKQFTRGGESATRRLTLRDALAGYGQGVGSVIGAASTAAGNEYGDKYSALLANATNTYRAGAEGAREFNERERDIAKTNYGGEMAEWGREQDVESKYQDMLFKSKWEQWKSGETAKAGREAVRNQREAQFWDLKQKREDQYMNRRIWGSRI